MGQKRSEYSEMYRRVLQEYGLDKGLNNNNRTKITDYLRRHYKKLYGEVRWDDLAAFEQDFFIYVHIRDKMFDTYLQGKQPSKIREIKKKINCEAEQAFLQNVTPKNNRKNVNIFARYDLSGLTDEEIDAKYDEFCNDFRTHNYKMPIPSRKKWKKNPLRIYDYIMEFTEELLKDDEIIPLDREVDHYIVKAICKVLEVDWKRGIDVPQIEACVAQCKKYPLSDTENILFRADENIAISTPEQREMEEKMEENHAKTRACQLKLDDIGSFIYDIDG